MELILEADILISDGRVFVSDFRVPLLSLSYLYDSLWGLGDCDRL